LTRVLNALVLRVKTTTAGCNDEVSYVWNTEGSCDIHRTRTYPCRHILPLTTTIAVFAYCQNTKLQRNKYPINI